MLTVVDTVETVMALAGNNGAVVQSGQSLLAAQLAEMTNYLHDVSNACISVCTTSVRLQVKVKSTNIPTGLSHVMQLVLGII